MVKNHKLGRRCLVIFGHGRKKGLGCALRDFLLQELSELGANVRLHDLVEDGFDPVLRLGADQPIALPPSPEEDPLTAQYCDDVLWAEVLIFLHPVWWFSMPAVMKGWLDRVFVEGVAIAQGSSGNPIGLLGEKKAILVQTLGTSSIIERTVFGGMARKFWQRAVFLPTELNSESCLSLHSAEKISPAQFESFCQRIASELRQL